jgi:F5/8 type C domain.
LENAKFAIDGDKITNTSRWVATATAEHLIEIDLGQGQSINGFATWIGYNGIYENAVKEFYFQIYSDGEWQTIESEKSNVDAKYISAFPEVVARRVRYYVLFILVIR